MTRSKRTMKVNAPTVAVMEWRRKFPGMRDSEAISIAWSTSLLRAEAALRPKRMLPTPESIINDKTKKKPKRKKLIC